MFHKIVKLLVGDLDEKRKYKQMMKRVDALPKDYRLAFKKMQKYMYCVGAPSSNVEIFTDMTMFTELVELFEVSVADGRPVVDVIGRDVAQFCDAFMRAYVPKFETVQEKLNKEVMERFNKEVGS